MLLMRWIVALGIVGCVCMQAIAQENPAADATGAQQRPTAVPQGNPQERAAPARAFIAPEQAVAEALQGVLEGYRFNKRLLAQSPQDSWLLFTRGPHEVALVGWTERTGTDEELLALAPATPMYFGLYRYDGEQIRPVQTVGREIGMVLGREPKILLPSAPNALLMLAASAETMPAVIRVRGPQLLELNCEFRNPIDEIAVMPVPDMGKTIALKPGGSTTIRKEVQVGRSSQPIYTSIGAMGIRQPVTIVVENPLELSVRPEEPQALVLDILNTGGEEFKGEVLLALANAEKPFRLPLQFRKGQRLHSVRIPLGTPLPLPSPMVVSVEQTLAQPMRRTFSLGQTGALQFAPAANFTDKRADGSPLAYRVQAAGGASAVARGGLPAGTAVPWPDYGTLGLVYDLGSAAQEDSAQIDIVATADWAQQVYENPRQIGFWLQGDGSGNRISLVWSDAQGREYASQEQVIDWRGWRYLLLDVPSGGDIAYPLRWAALLRLRGGSDAATRQGALLANGFCFIYGDNSSTSGLGGPTETPYEQSVTIPQAPIEISEPEIIRGKPLQRGGGGGGGK